MISMANVWSSPPNRPIAHSKTASNIRPIKSKISADFIFAYIGPEPAPLMPRYDLLLTENGERVIGAGTEYCNWLQRAENSVDQTHLVALHAPEYPQMALKRPEIGWEKTAYGAKITMHVPGRVQAQTFALGFPIAYAPYHRAQRSNTGSRDPLPRAHRRHQNDDVLAALHTVTPTATSASRW